MLAGLTGICGCGKTKQETTINQPEQHDFPYNLERATETCLLPDQLEEISGIDTLDEQTWLCIQDEEGAWYEYNCQQAQITGKTRFGPDGDFEDIAQLGGKVWAITSNGIIWEIDPQKGTQQWPTPLSELNNPEGLSPDRNPNYMLIACKDRPLSERQGIRAIYRWALPPIRKLDPVPAFSIPLPLIRKKILDTHQEKDPTFRETLKTLPFRLTALAWHPITRQLFVLTDSPPALLRLDTTGKLLDARMLSPDHPKPEGITFDRDARLIISNEGAGGKASIRIYKYQPAKRKK